MPREIRRFEVSLKAFIHRDGKALLVREADTGYWELPGGRIDVGEEWIPHSDVLARELREELGAGVRISIGRDAVTWVRQRPTDEVFQFIVARICRLSAGEPVLSDEHSQIGWFARAESLVLGYPEHSSYPDAIRRLWDLAAVGAESAG